MISNRICKSAASVPRAGTSSACRSSGSRATHMRSVGSPRSELLTTNNSALSNDEFDDSVDQVYKSRATHMRSVGSPRSEMLMRSNSAFSDNEITYHIMNLTNPFINFKSRGHASTLLHERKSRRKSLDLSEAIHSSELVEGEQRLRSCPGLRKS